MADSALSFEAVCGVPKELEPPPLLTYHVPLCLVWFLVMGAIDFVVLRPRLLKGAPWFALHSSMNMLVTVFGLSDVMYILDRPHCAMVAPTQSWIPSHIAVTLHVYHCVAYTELRFDDIFHHAVFVAPFAAMQLTMMWGPICNLLMFFITGLPGGIDYALLVLVKQGRLSRLQEKRYNASIMVWLRMPGLLFFSSVQYVGLRLGFYRVSWYWIVLCMFLGAANGIFYMAQVHENYHIKRAEGDSSKGQLKIHERMLGGKARKT
eukprot:g7905.t1